MRNSFVRSVAGCLVLVIAVAWLVPAAFAQIDINVNTSSTIASGVKNKYGMNVNAAVDNGAI